MLLVLYKVKVKGPTQPTLRLLGAEHCRQIALINGYDTNRAPLLEASTFPRETRGTYCIDPGGMKGCSVTDNICPKFYISLLLHKR